MPGRTVPVLRLPEAPALTPDAGPVQALYVPSPLDAFAPSLSSALSLAREELAEQQVANIHDHLAMMKAATVLETRLRLLLAALDADGIGCVDVKRVAS